MADTTNLRNDLVKLGDKMRFSSRLLEKDYHLTRILHKISEKEIKGIVFKGGTCLNKCYLGFYRLSEDLDFVYNQDVKSLTKNQIRKILNNLRRELIEILEGLGFETNKELGGGWKMLTSKLKPNIIGLEIITKYNSLIDNSIQTIKLEISFRKKLRKPTKMKIIKHELFDDLGKPMLKEDVEIEVIDLTENFAEKFRALLTRRTLAIRDVYDIYFILKNNLVKIDKGLMDLILAKINESADKKFTKEDLTEFIRGLDFRLSDLNEKEISSLLKSGEKVNVKEMIRMIIKNFEDFEK